MSMMMMMRAPLTMLLWWRRRVASPAGSDNSTRLHDDEKNSYKFWMENIKWNKKKSSAHLHRAQRDRLNLSEYAINFFFLCAMLLMSSNKNYAFARWRWEEQNSSEKKELWITFCYFSLFQQKRAAVDVKIIIIFLINIPSSPAGCTSRPSEARIMNFFVCCTSSLCASIPDERREQHHNHHQRRRHRGILF